MSALTAVYLNNPLNQSSYYGNYVGNGKVIWEGKVLEIPKESGQFFKSVMEVNRLSVKSESKIASGLVQVYFKKPTNKKLIIPGSQFRIKSELRNILLPLNPYEFNYQSYMADKGIHYQTFVNAGDVEIIHAEDKFSLLDVGSGIKMKIIEYLKSGELNDNAVNLTAALLTGYDDEINSETINAFAHSGTLHVLSVSGLHTGLIFTVLLFLLGWFDKNNRFKISKLIIILFFLWLFVLITGFSPPVLRAAIMLSFIATGKYVYNYFQNTSLNILAVSAFILLLFNPLLLFDTGFLLSYFAVIGILVFHPHLKSVFNFKLRFASRIWELCSVSISATCSTLPLTLLFFHQFPIWFVFTNLIIIPICTILMFTGIMYLFKIKFLAHIINFLTALVLRLVEFTDKPEIGYIDKIDFSISDMLFLTAIIFCVFWLLKTRNFGYALTSLVLMIGWQFYNILTAYNEKQEISCIVYQINKHSAFEIKDANKLYFTGNIEDKNYNFHIRNNHVTYNYPADLRGNFDYMKISEFSILNVRTATMIPLINILKPTCLIFSDNCIPEQTIEMGCSPEWVIADGSCNFSSIRKIKKFCSENKYKFYSTRESGFLKLSLN